MIDVATAFAPGGPLERTLPSFEARPQQVRMAEEVMAALAAGRHLLVEAGTGVGKSLAYLVPAILWATRPDPEGTLPPEERRVVVSTHTRALQEQLARKDLPFLERALGRAGIPFRHALLMGSENYLCLQRLHEAGLQRVALPDEGWSGILAALRQHAGSSATGLRSGIPFAIPDALWRRLCRDREICLGARGPFWEACLYRRDLLRAREAHVLVVNHALFFLDLKTGGRILPPHATVILDEAHRAEEAALSQLDVAVSDRSLARLLEDLGPPRRVSRRRDPEGPRFRPEARARDVARARARVAAEAGRFFEEARRQAELLSQARSGLSRPAARSASRAEGTGLIVRVREAGLAEDRLSEPLADLAAALEEEARTVTVPESQALASLAARARDLRERLSLFLTQSLPDAVYWVEAARRRAAGVGLHAAPIEVSALLRPRLFESGRRIVLTSATLAASGSFAHVRARLGITAASEAALGSPFDFERQALLYLPPAMPDPVSAAERFQEEVALECRRLIEASEGGAFVLFTSYALLRRVHDALASDKAIAHLRLFRHEPGAASSILEDFRLTRRGVLLGTLTFWQGVDVPGDALRSVIITRLPFEVPDHPLAEARAEAIRARGGDPFLEDSLPEAILTLRQGFGRLIRTRDDRGLVAILDPRLQTRGYGRSFLESLPRCPRTGSIEEVRRFFRAAAPEGRLS